MVTPMPRQQCRQHEKVRFPKLPEVGKFEEDLQPSIPSWLDPRTVDKQVQAHLELHAFRMKPEEKRQFELVIQSLLPSYFLLDAGTYRGRRSPRHLRRAQRAALWLQPRWCVGARPRRWPRGSALAGVRVMPCSCVGFVHKPRKKKDGPSRGAGPTSFGWCCGALTLRFRGFRRQQRDRRGRPRPLVPA